MIKLLLLDVDGTLTDGKLHLLKSSAPIRSSMSADSGVMGVDSGDRSSANPSAESKRESSPESMLVQESKSFHVHDGLGIVAWRKLGREVAIISGRESGILSARARELGITRVFMGVGDKSNIARNIITGLGLSKDEVACIGDDLNDLGMFRECGLCFTPANACAYLKSKSHVQLSKNGGEGAVREMIEFILQRNEEEYQEFLALYE